MDRFSAKLRKLGLREETIGYGPSKEARRLGPTSTPARALLPMLKGSNARSPNRTRHRTSHTPSHGEVLPWLRLAFAHDRRMKQHFPDPRIVAARKALASRPPAPLERVLEQVAASRSSIADQMRESRAKHPLNTHEEAIAQMRRFREAMDESAARAAPSSSEDHTAPP